MIIGSIVWAKISKCTAYDSLLGSDSSGKNNYLNFQINLNMLKPNNIYIYIFFGSVCIDIDIHMDIDIYIDISIVYIFGQSKICI